MTDHKSCPQGSHTRTYGDEDVTFTCSVDGGVLVMGRCPAIMKNGLRCGQGINLYDRCFHHRLRHAS